FFVFFVLLLPPPSSTLFPYTTLFRSRLSGNGLRARDHCCILVAAVVFRGAQMQVCYGRLGIKFRGAAKLPRSRLRLAQCDVSFRSEEHTSELQSRGHLVCRLLLEKKN